MVGSTSRWRTAGGRDRPGLRRGLEAGPAGSHLHPLGAGHAQPPRRASLRHDLRLMGELSLAGYEINLPHPAGLYAALERRPAARQEAKLRTSQPVLDVRLPQRPGPGRPLGRGCPSDGGPARRLGRHRRARRTGRAPGSSPRSGRSRAGESGGTATTHWPGRALEADRRQLTAPDSASPTRSRFWLDQLQGHFLPCPGVIRSRSPGRTGAWAMPAPGC